EGPPIYCLTAREAPDERSSGRESNDSGSEADQDRRGDIADGESPVALVGELQRLVVEGRVGGEATHDACREKDPHDRWDRGRLEADVHDQTDEIGPDDIHRQRAVGERRPEEAEGSQGDEVARATTERASHANPHESIHPVSFASEGVGGGTRTLRRLYRSRRSHWPSRERRVSAGSTPPPHLWRDTSPHGRGPPPAERGPPPPPRRAAPLPPRAAA